MSSPTVGDLLRVADLEIRALNWDTPDLSAPETVAGWLQLAGAARDVLLRIPGLDPATEILITPEVLYPTAQSHTPEPRLAAAAVALREAAAILDQSATPAKTGMRPPDAEPARQYVARTLFIATHATAASVRRQEALVAQQTSQPGLSNPRREERLVASHVANSFLRPAAGRLELVEARISHYLQGRGDVPAPSDDLSETRRLQVGLQRWDAAATSVVSRGRPASQDLVGIADTQAALATAGIAFLNIAAESRQHAPTPETRHLRYTLEALPSAWRSVSENWRPLTVTGADWDRPLAEAQREVHASLMAILTDGAGWVSTDVAASRVHLSTATRALDASLFTSSALAARFSDLPYELAADRALTARANLLARLDPPPVALRPIDIANKRVVALHPSDVDRMAGQAHQLGRAVSRAMAAVELAAEPWPTIRHGPTRLHNADRRAAQSPIATPPSLHPRR